MNSLLSSAPLWIMADGVRVPTQLFADLVRTVLQNDSYLLGWFDYYLNDPNYSGLLGYKSQAEYAYAQQTGLDSLDYSASILDWVPGTCYSATDNNSSNGAVAAVAGLEADQAEPLGVLIRRAIKAVLARETAEVQTGVPAAAEP